MSRARRTDAVAAADGLCRDGGRVLGCGPMPWQQLDHVLGRMRSKPGEDVAEPGGRVDAVELGGLGQRVDDGSALAAIVGAGDQPVLAAERNRGVILPMSGRKLKFVTSGTPSMGGAFGASMLSGAPAARLYTSRWRPAWSSWWRHGCLIPPPAAEWHSAHRASRCRRWLSCIGS